MNKKLLARLRGVASGRIKVSDAEGLRLIALGLQGCVKELRGVNRKVTAFTKSI